MKEIATTTAAPLRKHLLPAPVIARSAAMSSGTHLARGRGQGNGVRMHAVYFAVVSLVALLFLIGAVAVATTMG